MLKLNAYLGVKLAQMENVILDFQPKGRAITHEHIINAYNADGNVLFVDFSRKELEAAKSTIGENYYDTIRYQLEKLYKFHPNLTFQQLDYSFLQKYAYYLTAKGNKPNTLKSDFIMIRKFLNLAIKKGHTKNYPFADFTIPSEEAVKEYLTLQEVEQAHKIMLDLTSVHRPWAATAYNLKKLLFYPDRPKAQGNTLTLKESKGNHFVLS